MHASDLFDKWIREPMGLVDFMAQHANSPNAANIQIPNRFARAHRLMEQNKITTERRRSVKGAEAEVQEILRSCTADDQYERDVAMWYGYCDGNSEGAAVCLKLFAALKTFGVLYRDANGAWQDFGATFPRIPVASLLSHGGRILFQLPMSNSGAREFGNKTATLVKGLTLDPITALGNRGMFHTLRGKSTGGAVAGHAILRVTGLASAGAILSTPHKVYAAGDDRMWDFLGGRDLHERAAATHSTIQTDWDNAPTLPNGRALFFTEEKATGSHATSNLRDALMSRHRYKNLALGGVGNMNPFSGVTIDKDGAHGHLYVNYRAPQYKRFGCILLGVEGSAPGKDNQYGKVHDANAVKGEFSATGGKKWNLLLHNRFYESNDKADVTVFVCDMSARTTSAAQGDIVAAGMTAANLDESLSRVTAADWTPVANRV